MVSHFRASAFFTRLQVWRPQHRLWFKLLKLQCRTLRADWGGQKASSSRSALSRLVRFPGLCSCCPSPEVFPGRLQERPTSLECPSRPAHSIDCRIAFQEWGLDTPNQFAKSQFPKWSIRWMTNLPWVEGSFFYIIVSQRLYAEVLSVGFCMDGVPHSIFHISRSSVPHCQAACEERLSPNALSVFYVSWQIWLHVGIWMLAMIVDSWSGEGMGLTDDRGQDCQQKQWKWYILNSWIYVSISIYVYKCTIV